MATDSTNQPPSEKTAKQVNNGFTTDSDLGKNYWAEGPTPTQSWAIGTWGTGVAYEFLDGSTGFALYNGKTAFHFDNNNNITISAGSPGQSGCGGKFVLNTQAQLQKSKSIAIEVTGRDDGGTVNK